MTKHTTEWQARAEALGYLKQLDVRCPRRLVGKRCRNLERGGSCWCTSPLQDHAASYTRHGRAVVLWEPYQAHPDELLRVFTAAAQDGIRVMVHGMSPWNPGSTVAVEFTRAEGVE